MSNQMRAGVRFGSDLKWMAATGFAARTTSPCTGAPASMRNSAWTISDCKPEQREHLLDVGAGMTVAAVQFQTIADAGVCFDRVLEREHEEPIRAQRSRGGRDDVLAGRRNTPACPLTRSGRRPRCCRAGTRSARLSPARRRRASPSRAPACPSERSTPISRRANGATSAPQSPVPQPASSTSRRLRRLEAGILQHRRNERRCAIRQLRELRFEARRKTVEGLPRRNHLTRVRGTSRPVHAASMCRAIGSVRLFCEPFLEDVHRLADLAQRAMRQRQQLARFPVLRPERDHLAVARRRFLGPLQPVEQNAEIGVRVDVFGVSWMAARYAASASAGFRSLSAPRRDCCARSRGSGSMAIARRYASTALVQPAVRLEDDSEVAVPVRLVGREREAPLDERDSFVVAALADARARRRSAAPGDDPGAVRARGDTARRPRRAGRSSAAGSRTRPPPRASARASVILTAPWLSGSSAACSRTRSSLPCWP